MKIDVLGTKYNLRRVNYNQDEFMRKMNYGGYCDNNTKEIVILNLKAPRIGLRLRKKSFSVWRNVPSGMSWFTPSSMSPGYSGIALPRIKRGPKTRKWLTGLPSSFRRCMKRSGSPEGFEVILWIIGSWQTVLNGTLGISRQDHAAYIDLLSLCRQWEAEDFQAAHEVSKGAAGHGGKAVAPYFPERGGAFL